jgi:hypothetical protein
MQSVENGAIQKGRIFILGAAFSAAAGIPLTASLLEQAMQLFRSECPGVFERVRNYTQIAFGLEDSELDYKIIGFSELCTFLDYAELRESGGGERRSDHGSRERLALKHYLGKAVTNNTPEPESLPELYRAFATQLLETDVVITFNWDCLLESALVAIGKPYTYGASDNRPRVRSRRHAQGLPLCDRNSSCAGRGVAERCGRALSRGTAARTSRRARESGA